MEIKPISFLLSLVKSSGIAPRRNLEPPDRKMVGDIFIFKKPNRDAQNELRRKMKTPEETLSIAAHIIEVTSLRKSIIRAKTIQNNWGPRTPDRKIYKCDQLNFTL